MNLTAKIRFSNLVQSTGALRRVAGSCCLSGVVALSALFLPTVTPASDYPRLRQDMVQEIASDVRLTSLELGAEALKPEVMAAMGAVPRHEFVPAEVQLQAYENRPLPIGFGQTISQPYIVAIMTDLLDTTPNDQVFELGTGSGYQAAVLSGLVKRVYTMEIIEELGNRAAEALQRLGYANVQVRTGDGYYGWPEKGPFDAIVVTAAGDHIPPPLVRQLKAGGRMVIPVGSRFFTQQLILVEKQLDGTVTTREILPVAFVPLTGKH